MLIIILFPWSILAGMASINLGRRYRRVNVRSH
jgi:hypothetical protein